MPLFGSLKIKAQVLCGGAFAIGPGKADLMEAIDREGSISAAGRVLGMSYRRAWMLVDTLNRCWTDPLIETTPGGGEAKGARLTECGREVLTAYRALERSLAEAADAEPMRLLQGRLRAVPRFAGPAVGGSDFLDQ
jgi:molybdate transport system regulatory protein